MSGLSRTPGKRVGANHPPRVRIPPSPPRPLGPTGHLEWIAPPTHIKAHIPVAVDSCVVDGGWLLVLGALLVGALGNGLLGPRRHTDAALKQPQGKKSTPPLRGDVG